MFSMLLLEQICRIWGKDNPQVIQERPLCNVDFTLVVWLVRSVLKMSLQTQWLSMENDMWLNLYGMDLDDMWFQ